MIPSWHNMNTIINTINEQNRDKGVTFPRGFGTGKISYYSHAWLLPGFLCKIMKKMALYFNPSRFMASTIGRYCRRSLNDYWYISQHHSISTFVLTISRYLAEHNGNVTTTQSFSTVNSFFAILTSPWKGEMVQEWNILEQGSNSLNQYIYIFIKIYLYIFINPLFCFCVLSYIPSSESTFCPQNIHSNIHSHGR